jgi:hypothetical protein
MRITMISDTVLVNLVRWSNGASDTIHELEEDQDNYKANVEDSLRDLDNEDLEFLERACAFLSRRATKRLTERYWNS